MSKNFIALLALYAFFSPHASLASTGELYGFGSRASAMGNTMIGGVSDGFATFYNPAANSSHPGLSVSLGTTFMHPSFLEIKDVTIANSATTAQTTNVTGDVDTTSYLDHLSQALGVSMNFGEKLKFLTVGATAVMPIARVAYIDSGEPFKPEYFSYRSRTQRPQIYASLSATPFPHFHLGAGLAFATNLSANTTAFATGSSDSISHQRFATTIKPSIAPYFSVFFNPDPVLVGLTVRMANTYKISIDTTANARLLGPVNDLPLVLNSSSSIFYDPLEIDLGLGLKTSENSLLTAEVDWLQYKVYEVPTLSVTDLGSGFRIKNSISTAPTMRNIFVPKVGLQVTGESIVYRFGASYRPSPVEDNSGPGNLVDPAKIIGTAGIGVDLKKMGLTQKEIVLDLHAQYHHMIKQHIEKAANNEAGVAGQSKIGSPGYDIGGHIYGGGLSLSMNF